MKFTLWFQWAFKIIKLTLPLFSAKKVEKQLAAENSTEREDSEMPEECDEEYDELEEGENAKVKVTVRPSTRTKQALVHKQIQRRGGSWKN